jgi:PAS domain S-box-containing protein
VLAFLLVSNATWHAAELTAASAAAAVAMAVGVWRHRPERRRTWVALGLGQVLVTIAWARYYLIPAITGEVIPFPNFGDVLFLFAYGLSAVGLLMSVGPAVRRDRFVIIDTAVLTVGVGVLSWVFLIAPYANGGLGLAPKLVSMGYPTMNVLLVALAARLSFAAGSTPRARLLVAWTIAQLTADTVYSVQVLHGGFTLAGHTFVPWIFAYAFLGSAALHPSMGDRAAPGSAVGVAAPASRLRLAVLAAAVLPLPVLLVVRAVERSTEDVQVIAAGSVVITAFVMTRVLATPHSVSADVRRVLRRSTARLVAAFVLLGLLPLAGLAYFGVHESGLTMDREIRERMSGVSAVSADYVAEQVRGLEQLVVSYAARPSLAAALTSTTPDLPELQRQLAALQGSNPEIFTAWMMGTQGALQASAPETPHLLGRDFSSRDYFRGAMKARDVYVSGAYLAATPGNPRAIGIAAPVRDNSGQVVGIIAVGYRLDGIRAFADRLARAQDVQLTVTDQAGVILAGVGSARTGLPSLASDPRVAAALRGSVQTRRVADADGASLSSYRPVSPLGWAVLAETPERVAFAAQRDVASRIMIAAVLLGQALLAGLVAAVYFDRRRLKVEASLIDREEHVRGILEAAGDGFVAIDHTGRIIEWNAQAAVIFGYSREEALGADLVELTSLSVERDGQRRLIAKILEGNEAGPLGRRVEITARHADGTVFPTETTLWVAAQAGRRTLNAFVQDVTDRKRQEAEVANARDAALEASRLKSEFVANMSHEIRTPMNGVLGMTSLLLETQLNPIQRDYAETVGNSAEALLVVINDILDFSKIEAGKLDLEATDFVLRPVIEEVTGLLAAAAQAKGLEVTALVDLDVPAAVRGDSHRLRQVLTNLIGNAVKFTERGEVAVHVHTVAGGLRFTVRDTGIGITPAQRERLFQAFTQADTSTTRRYGGTGLGLTISRQLVELMGGELDFASVAGEGTTFWADLPLPTAAAPPVVTPVRSYYPDARVLVVDDNATNRKVLQQFLASWCLEPHCVSDGPSALSALRTAAADGSPFAAVFLDMHMPEMSGLEVAEAVFADPLLTGTPIAVLTSNQLPGEAERFRELGVGVCLTKPVREAQLYEALSGLLDEAAPAAPQPVDTVPVRRPDQRLLVAEDNAVNQQVIVAMLRALGFDADVAVDGQHALELFSSGEYAAVLMDCQMPRMDGYAATRAIRRLDGGAADVPIIALTASALAADEQRCRDAGMDDFVTKPIRSQTLAHVLERWVPVEGSPQYVPSARDPLDSGVLAELGKLGPELLHGVATAFLDTVPARTAELRIAAGRQDVDEVRQLAHGVRGSAGYVGATALADMYAELESGDLTRLDEVDAELDRVCAALREVLAEAR